MYVLLKEDFQFHDCLRLEVFVMKKGPFPHPHPTPPYLTCLLLLATSSLLSCYFVQIFIFLSSSTPLFSFFSSFLPFIPTPTRHPFFSFLFFFLLLLFFFSVLCLHVCHNARSLPCTNMMGCLCASVSMAVVLFCFIFLFFIFPSSSGENKTIVSQVLKDMSEMTSKMRFLDLFRTHLQVGEGAPKGNFSAPKPSPE